MRRLTSLLLIVAAVCAADPDIPLTDNMGDFDDEDEVPELKSAVKVEDIPKPKYTTVPYKAPSISPSALLAETFQYSNVADGGWKKVKSEKFGGVMEPVLRGTNYIDGDKGLKMSSDSQHHALVKPLKTPFTTSTKSSIYGTMEVEYENKVECGGAYFKLFDSGRLADGDITEFDETTNYSIMFGPDRCGYMTNKVHLIIKYPHPTIEGEWVEEHLRDAPKINSTPGAHQYGFAIHPNNTVQIYMDGVIELEGNMKEIFKKGFSNEAEVDDESDKKPSDWVDEVMIPDPNAVKPDDWDEDAPQTIIDEDAVMPEGWLVDEPEMIVNPEAEKPEDWDDEEDGEWKAPMMKNPACYVGCGPWKRPTKPNPDYKGPWKAPMIENPDYKGEWQPRKVPNPNHYDIEDPYTMVQPFNSIGFELWTVESGAMFDNILITPNKADFDRWLAETFMYKNPIEKENYAKKSEYEKRLKSAELGESGSGNGRPSEKGFFSKLVEGASILAAENKLVFLLTVGVPIATTGYVISRVLRRGMQTMKGSSKVTVPEAEMKPTTGEKKSVESELPRKDSEKPEVRKRRAVDEKEGEKEEADTAATEQATENEKKD